METRYLNADLLILGGGSAGCMAAIRALDLNPELKVVIFEKGDIKYSGSIARGMDALNIVTIPNYTTPYLYLGRLSILPRIPRWDDPPGVNEGRRPELVGGGLIRSLGG